MSADIIRGLIRDVPDFPKPGVMFKDITPVLADASAFDTALDLIIEPFAGSTVTKVAGIEARGFMFAAPIACRLDAGFVPIRKPGTLPREVVEQECALEYGTDRLQVHADAVESGDRVLVIDDVLATGGTASASVQLLRRLGADVVGVSVLLELVFLEGRAKLDGISFHAVVSDGGA
jgi:adenine phosphoribosyltransferase